MTIHIVMSTEFYVHVSRLDFKPHARFAVGQLILKLAS